MSAELITVLMLASLAILLTGFPLAFCIGTVGLVFGLISGGPVFLYMIPTRIMTGVLSNYILAAVPLFIFMGNMMTISGIADKAFYILERWMGGIRGGVAIATIVLAVIFAATTGVVGASVTAIGLLAVPVMLRGGYSQALASGCVCAGGTLGILIPPSIMLILYAPMAGVSVIKMFAGAIVPGLLLGLFFILYILIYTFLKPESAPALPAEERVSFFTLQSLIDGFKYLVPPVVLILVILGSILMGFASPTEAGAIGCVATTIMAIAYRKLNLRNFLDACYQTIKVNAMIILIAIAASLFTGAFLNAGCGKVIVNALNSLGLGRWGILIILLTIILFLGMFIDWIGILMILIPIFAPMLSKLGFDPLWIGIVICTSLQMSFLTPPFAYSIFYLKGINDELTLNNIYKGVVPFVIIQLMVTVLIIIFPQLCLWLPNMM